MNINIKVNENEIRELLKLSFSDNVSSWIKEIRLSDHYYQHFLEKDVNDEFVSFSCKENPYLYYVHPYYCIDIFLYQHPWKSERLINEAKVPLYRLSKFNIETGLTIMGDKYRDHLLDFIAKDYYSEIGDVFLQCALFHDSYF